MFSSKAQWAKHSGSTVGTVLFVLRFPVQIAPLSKSPSFRQAYENVSPAQGISMARRFRAAYTVLVPKGWYCF